MVDTANITACMCRTGEYFPGIRYTGESSKSGVMTIDRDKTPAEVVAYLLPEAGCPIRQAHVELSYGRR